MPTAFAIAAHPDDIELFMAGTLMLLGDAGYQIHYMNVANGCCGSSEFDAETTAQIRRKEAKLAAGFAGAIYHESICDDLAVFYDQPTIARMASIVREVGPDILLTHSPQDYMEDHMTTCRLAVSAAFVRSMPNCRVDPPRAPVTNNVTIYHAQPYSHHDQLRRRVVPDLFVNVTSVIDRKVEMLSKHASQKKWLDESQGHDSYLQTLRDLDAECGRMSEKFEFAEGWRRHLHLGFCQEMDDPLSDALGAQVLKRK